MRNANANRLLCGTPGPREELVEDAGLDAFEMRALEVVRLIFATLSGSLPRYAPDVTAVAGTLFGPHRGAVIHAGLASLVQTMALSRSQPFHYSNPFCEGCARILTQNEGHLLRMLHHIRRGQTGRAMTHALLICDTRPVSLVMDVGADLATLAPLGCDPQV